MRPPAHYPHGTLSCGAARTAGHQLLNELVDFLGLLALPAALGVDDVAAHAALQAGRVAPLLAHQADLLHGMWTVGFRVFRGLRGPAPSCPPGRPPAGLDCWG